MDYQKTGQVIAQRRQELAWTQKDLAQKLNISDRTVSRWERGVGFPDISLLEPLADALGLSVLELIHGPRLPEQPPPEAEQNLRTASRDLGNHFRRTLVRSKYLLAVLTLVLAILAGMLWWLEIQPNNRYIIKTSPITASQAAQLYPSAIITRQEFALGARLLANEEITRLLSDTEPYNVTPLDPSLVEEGELLIDGQPAQLSEIYVVGTEVNVDYSVLMEEGPPPVSRRCILEFSQSGLVRKTMEEYRSGGWNNMKLVENTDNEEFALHDSYRDLFYPFRHAFPKT